MRNVIKTRVKVGMLFKQCAGIIAVYGDNNFSFDGSPLHFYVLCMKSLDRYDLYTKLVAICGEDTQIAMAESEHNKLFVNKKVIWKDGNFQEVLS